MLCYAILAIFLYEDRFIRVLVEKKADYMTDTVYITQISQIFVIVSCFNPCLEFCQRWSNSDSFFNSTKNSAHQCHRIIGPPAKGHLFKWPFAGGLMVGGGGPDPLPPPPPLWIPACFNPYQAVYFHVLTLLPN